MAGPAFRDEKVQIRRRKSRPSGINAAQFLAILLCATTGGVFVGHRLQNAVVSVFDDRPDLRRAPPPNPLTQTINFN